MINHGKRIALATAVFAFAAAGVCLAADQPQTKQTNPAPAAKADTRKETRMPAGEGGSMIFIDPATGKTRAPEPGEVEALTASKAKSVTVAAQPVPFKSNIGGVAVKLTDESMVYSVVSIGPDGKLKESCVTGAKAAQAALTAKPAPAKEALDEK